MGVHSFPPYWQFSPILANSHIGSNMGASSYIGVDIPPILSPIWEYSHIGALHRANTSSFQYGSKTPMLESNMGISRT